MDSGPALARALEKLAPLLHERDGVAYRAASKGTGGRVYRFARTSRA